MHGSNLSGVVIETHKLSKVYGKQTAVDNLNLTVREGDIYGFLGQNGAGKTTTIRMLLGLVKPTAGVAKIFGEAITSSTREIFKRVGTLVEHPSFYYDLTVYDNLDIHRRLFGVTNRQAIDEALELLNLSNHKHKGLGPYLQD